MRRIPTPWIAYACVCTLALFWGAVVEAGEGTLGRRQPIAFALKGSIYFLTPGTSRLPDFTKLTPEGMIYTETLDVPTRHFRKGFPGVTNRLEWFAIDYHGFFRVERAGTYKFALTSDDGAKLFIDDRLIIDNDGVHPPRTVEGIADLRRGRHKIRVQYFQGPAYQIALVLKVAEQGEELKPFSTQEMGVSKNWLEVLMDTTTLVATFGLLAFMVERLTNGIAIVLGYWDWWRMRMEIPATADPDTRASLDRNRRVGLFAMSALLAVVGALLTQLNLLAQLGLGAEQNIGGQIVTGLLIASGADPIREVWRLRERGPEPPAQAAPIHVSGTVILQQAPSGPTEKGNLAS